MAHIGVHLHYTTAFHSPVPYLKLDADLNFLNYVSGWCQSQTLFIRQLPRHVLELPKFVRVTQHVRHTITRM